MSVAWRGGNASVVQSAWRHAAKTHVMLDTDTSRDVVTEEDGDAWEAAAVSWCLIVLH